MILLEMGVVHNTGCGFVAFSILPLSGSGVKCQAGYILDPTFLNYLVSKATYAPLLVDFGGFDQCYRMF